MKLKNILILILCIVLCPPIVMAVSDNTVYTEFTGGNSSSTGNGTEQSPYNLFEDALNAVEDGGTICVGEKGAFVNSSDDKPLVINKNVTITSKSDTAPEISIRKAGVVLGGNVSFKNVVLSLVNGNHALIAANGYTLTLDNVTYFQNTREVHIVGGTLYDKNGVSLSPTAGEKSKIVLSGNKTHFGNIYAGSINGSFDKDVEIDINGVTGKNIGKVYSCGAKEGYYNSDNFLDPNNEPTAPTAGSAVYGVTGNVNINLSNSSICEIDGDCGSGRANVSVVTEYQYSSAMKNIGLLTVDSGMIELTEINDDVNVKINSNGILDMSNLGECSVNDFYGGGTLVLAKDGLLTVNGTLSGVTEFQTSGGVNSSGIAEYDRLYIKTSKGDGSFTFNPYATQSDMTLDKTVDGFKTSSKTEEAVVLKSFWITGSEFNDTSLEVNQGYFDIPIETEFEGSGFYDISMVPLVYTVSYNGKTYGPRNSTLTDDGNYEADFKELNMCFAPITGNISVSKYSSTIGFMDDIAEGVYDVTVTAPTASGNVERSFKLIKCEFYKFKRRSLFVLATLVALVFPVVMTALYWNIPTQVNYDNLFSGIVDYGDFLLLLPILVVIATSLFFTETDNDTLKNLTTIPISKSKIVVAKIGVMAIISVAYTLLGFFASVLCSKILGIAMENMAQKFVLSIGLGIMLLAAALPCVALVVWFNKSDLISIVITLFYTIINYVIHVTDIGMLTPVGVNIGTILPIPVINRWIYQFYDEGNGAAAEFYNTMRPYFVPTHICVCIIALFLFVSIYAIIKIYNRREI